MFNFFANHHNAGPWSLEAIGLLRRRFVKRQRSVHLAIEPLEGRALLNAGALDTTFGGTGMVTSHIQLDGDSYATTVQPDLKVVVVGTSDSAPSYAAMFTVVRYNTNGTLDTSFGSGGVAISGLQGVAQAVAIQPDGKILVAGYTEVAGKKKNTYAIDWAVERLNTNGSLDTTFGGGAGYVVTNFAPAPSSGSPAPDYVSAIAIQSNGQIVVAGQGTAGSASGVAVARYNANGSPDTTFGTGGTVVNTSMFWDGSVPGTADMLAIDSSGRIDVVGGSILLGVGEIEMARYLPNGTLDSSFGTGGIVKLMPTGASGSGATSIGLQSTGQIVIGTNTTFAPQPLPVLTLVRLNTNGSLDTTFGTGGFYSDGRITATYAIAIQPDDEIVAVGNGFVNGLKDHQFYITRVLANGSSYDPTFGTSGVGVSAWNPEDILTPSSVALGSDGSFVVTGKYDNTDFATARFLGNSTSGSINVAAAGPVSAANVPDPTIVPIVLEQSLFVGGLTSSKRHRAD